MELMQRELRRRQRSLRRAESWRWTKPEVVASIPSVDTPAYMELPSCEVYRVYTKYDEYVAALALYDMSKRAGNCNNVLPVYNPDSPYNAMHYVWGELHHVHHELLQYIPDASSLIDAFFDSYMA